MVKLEDSNLHGSWLFPVRRVSSTQTIKAPLQVVNRALHDAPTIIKLDPLVQSCSASTSQVGLWNVVNRIKLFALSFPLRYTALFKPSTWGTTIDVRTGPLTLRNTWQVSSPNGGKTTNLMMEVQTQTFFLLMPFLTGAIRKNHDTIMDKLKNEVEQNEKRS